MMVMFDVFLEVSMALIGYSRHEPNMLRSFGDLFFAGTIKPPPILKPVRMFFYWGGTFMFGEASIYIYIHTYTSTCIPIYIYVCTCFSPSLYI